MTAVSDTEKLRSLCHVTAQFHRTTAAGQTAHLALHGGPSDVIKSFGCYLILLPDFVGLLPLVSLMASLQLSQYRCTVAAQLHQERLSCNHKSQLWTASL
eukprot:GHUV01049199.1.p1 GENE.GHUV01049199.1~~GHUV01049199.1.p1  ORF type:complete len:100 (-),score=8.36 GHUV01049199.1:245-544(-)